MLTRLAVGALALVVVGAAGCSSGGGSTGDWPAARDTPPRIPASSLLVGAAVPRQLPADGPQAAAYTRFDDELGTDTQIAHLFRTWDQDLVPPDLSQVAADGKYPMLSWNGADIAGIVSGRYDRRIREQATALADSGVPTFLRFRWEMDRPNLRTSVGSPEAYVAAWRRVHRIFADVGTPSVSWVWCPTADGFAPGRDAAAFYPGDDVVDWLCADAYPGRELTPLATLLAPFLSWAEGHDKPVMIGEFGVPRTADDDARAAWLGAAGRWLADEPLVRAVVYFDLDVEPTARVLQFGIDPGTATALAFDQLARADDQGRSS
ncbi:glycoside hydrolase family 26 protein [Nocardioides sp. URHA0020]|uniref:glycoside hydrolase family 26 protein n=1 Tax=Nocardioides sp. URHA0020 TaxID=1380392 RepID=UPI000686E6C2|nr:glycosyl hydrolase [Nocardioides sp. URHA0020]